jgi:AP2-associated kinase
MFPDQFLLNSYPNQIPLSSPSLDLPGPFQVGQQLKVGQQLIQIESFIAEGGFAHVYSCILNQQRIVLKRISCSDKSQLQKLIQEAETQKQLTGHINIVSFIDYSYQYTTQYELLILMEHCAGGHLVDYLNSRLKNRLLEQEILAIFQQICKGVSHLHSQQELITHRDLKIENVLLSNGVFKICDFGSCTSKKYPANVNIPIQELRLLEEEVASSLF